MPPGQMINQLIGARMTIGTDAIYSFVIIFVSLMIYFGTRELYELSQHKGIKYFRLAFIFFALAYTFRFITQFILLSLNHPRSFNTDLGVLNIAALLIFMYASTTAIFYLWASNHWRWFIRPYSLLALHALALIISFLAIATQNTLLLIVIQALLVISLALTSYHGKNGKRKETQKLRFLYVLLAIFWAINFIDTLVPRYLLQIQLLIYMISIALFLILLQKVLRKI